MKRPRKYACWDYVSRLILILLCAGAVVSFGGTSAGAQTFSSGSTGADGAFNPACTPPATSCTVTVNLPASGIFNYTTVNIPSGVTVTYTRNAANTPVTILATGDVTISGRIFVNGEGPGPSNSPGRGGPGGFDGGMGGSPGLTLNGTPGLGPGGGQGGTPTTTNGLGGTGGFGTPGADSGGPNLGGPAYGTPTLLPLIGGSGGGGTASIAGSIGAGGGGGGGAILIASSGTITIATTPFPGGGTVSGLIFADGGTTGFNNTANGSGGAVRLVAASIAGGGAISARGGDFGSRGMGRIRLEAFVMAFSGSLLPAASAASIGTPRPVFPPTGFPNLKIASVGGVAAPQTPQGTFLAAPDIALSPSQTNPVTVTLVATNVPVGTIVSISVTPEGGTRTTTNSTPLTGTPANSTATATVTLPHGTCVINAEATFATGP